MLTRRRDGCTRSQDDTSHRICDQLAGLDLSNSGHVTVESGPKAIPSQKQQQGGPEAAATPLPGTAPALSSLDLAGVAALIKSGGARRVVVMAGAGISVSAGIPDFRTKGACWFV